MLPNKNTTFEHLYFNEDGSLKPGTKQYDYYQRLLKKTTDDSYARGVSFVLKDMVERLKFLPLLQVDKFEQLVPLPSYADELQKQLDAIKIYLTTLKSQINNRNVPNFREGTRKVISQVEKFLGLKKDEILDSFIAKDELRKKEAQKVNEPVQVNEIQETIQKPTSRRGRGTKKFKKEKVFDPTDELINVTTETLLEEKD